uniref:Uncharacterized protein n=1 Tax=Tanacetum cinerariifolium TaxID=118510 RepID=A0A6L2M5B9_TANCI|nr:hypothetical protein [Tanacetum cinerariifolium]
MRICHVSSGNPQRVTKEVFGNEVYGSDPKGFGVNPSSNEFRLCNCNEWRYGNHGGRVIIRGYGGGDMVEFLPRIMVSKSMVLLVMSAPAPKKLGLIVHFELPADPFKGIPYGDPDEELEEDPKEDSKEDMGEEPNEEPKEASK